MEFNPALSPRSHLSKASVPRSKLLCVSVPLWLKAVFSPKFPTNQDFNLAPILPLWEVPLQTMPPDTDTSQPKGKHGGARPGAGRKPRRDPAEYSNPNDPASLGEVLSALERNAKGTKSVTETWALAGTLTTGTGPDKRPLFPNLPPDQMVLVARKITKPKPDTRAGAYLCDRTLGRPASADTFKIEETVNAELQAFIEKVKDRFEPEVAQAIFRALTEPDGAPRSPLRLVPRSGDAPGTSPELAPSPNGEPFRLS